jgi:hypothetical protein
VPGGLDRGNSAAKPKAGNDDVNAFVEAAVV